MSSECGSEKFEPGWPGGSHDLMADLNRAREQGMKERGDGA